MLERLKRTLTEKAQKTLNTRNNRDTRKTQLQRPKKLQRHLSPGSTVGPKHKKVNVTFLSNSYFYNSLTLCSDNT